jgi:hypothetical protein
MMSQIAMRVGVSQAVERGSFPVLGGRAADITVARTAQHVADLSQLFLEMTHFAVSRSFPLVSDGSGR